MTIASHPDVGEIITRLGGKGPGPTPVQLLVRGRRRDRPGAVRSEKLTAVTGTGATARRVNAPFVLQEAGSIEDNIFNAPQIPGTGRPQDAVPSEGDPRAMGN